MIMGRLQPHGVFDGTPILLRLARNVPDIGNQAVCISAIFAIQLLHAIQIRQMTAINSEVVATADGFHTPDREAYFLKNRDSTVEQDQWNQHEIGQRHHNKSGPFCGPEESEQAHPDLMVFLKDGLFENNLLPFDPVFEVLAPDLDFFAQTPLPVP